MTSLLAAALQGTSQPAEPDGSAAQRQPGDVREDITGDEAAPALQSEPQEPTAAELDAAAGAGIPGPESAEEVGPEDSATVATGKPQHADPAADAADEGDSRQELPLAPGIGEPAMPPARDIRQAPPVEPDTASMSAEPEAEAAPAPLSDSVSLSDPQPAATVPGATGLEMQGDQCGVLYPHPSDAQTVSKIHRSGRDRQKLSLWSSDCF